MKYQEAFKKVEVTQTDYSTIDTIISKEYGIIWFECALDMSNGSYISTTVTGELTEAERAEFNSQLMEENQERDTLGYFLNDLCSKGIIDKGLYFIRVSW